MKKSTCLYIFIYLFCELGAVSADCEDGWVRHGDSCYLVSTRYPMEWIDAMTFCEMYEANLAEVETDTEATFLRHECHVYGAGGGTFWIGGSDVMAEGKWMWMTSHIPISYTNWARGTPSNNLGRQHCLSMYYHVGYLWNDEQCTLSLPFICEKNANSALTGFLVG
ncbi:galactose-specific lectin nattectin-like [Crassostrea virginica]